MATPPYPGVCRTYSGRVQGGVRRRLSSPPVEPKAAEEALRVGQRPPTLASAGLTQVECRGGLAAVRVLGWPTTTQPRVPKPRHRASPPPRLCELAAFRRVPDGQARVRSAWTWAALGS